MLFVLAAFIISFKLFYDTYCIHVNYMDLEKAHYKQQYIFYNTDKSEILNLTKQIEEMKTLHENTMAKYSSKLEKMEYELQQEINNYKIEENEDLKKDIKKEINNIDIHYLKQLVMETSHD